MFLRMNNNNNNYSNQTVLASLSCIKSLLTFVSLLFDCRAASVYVHVSTCDNHICLFLFRDSFSFSLLHFVDFIFHRLYSVDFHDITFSVGNQKPFLFLSKLHMSQQRDTKIVFSVPQSKKLVQASFSGDVKSVDRLLKTGKANPNYQDGDNKFTSLHAASQDNKLAVVRRLLREPNIDANLGIINGATSLVDAAGQSHVMVVLSLLAEGKADPDLADNAVFTPLIFASQNGL